MWLNKWIDTLRCPEHGASVTEVPDGLRCGDGHLVPVVEGILRFAQDGPAGRDERWSRFYDLWAPVYDVNERVGCRLLFGLDVVAERERIVHHLGIRAGIRLLEISPGPGVYQALLTNALGPHGRLAELDLSLGMLRECSRRAKRAGADPLLVQANAARLPFADETFDVVFHFGGVNLFSHPDQALAEMVRVTKRGGRVAWGDEGFGANAPGGWRRSLLKRINPGFEKARPAAPRGIQIDAELEVMGGCAWLVVARRTEGGSSHEVGS
jgi:ubiquinone/menaquinone biosynthesis C-methylase UbiE